MYLVDDGFDGMTPECRQRHTTCAQVIMSKRPVTCVLTNKASRHQRPRETLRSIQTACSPYIESKWIRAICKFSRWWSLSNTLPCTGKYYMTFILEQWIYPDDGMEYAAELWYWNFRILVQCPFSVYSYERNGEMVASRGTDIAPVASLSAVIDHHLHVGPSPVDPLNTTELARSTAQVHKRCVLERLLGIRALVMRIRFICCCSTASSSVWIWLARAHWRRRNWDTKFSCEN